MQKSLDGIRPAWTGAGALTALLVIAAIAGAVVWFLGSANPYTPAGYVGYLTRGSVFGKAEFVGLQNGPTSSGRGWLLDVVNISITPYTYGEDFSGDSAVLSKDNLKISFRVHLVWRVVPDKVRDFVEKYSTLQRADNPDKIVAVAYQNFLKEPLRTFARDEVQKLNGLEVKDQISELGDRVMKRVNALIGEAPFEIRSVVVGNIQYPVEVADAVSKKLAATQELERKNTEIEIMKREKEKRIVDAEGVAKAMEIINQRLTPQYLQYEAIKAQREMVGSQNHTTIYIPVGPMGVPLVGTFDAATGQSQPDSGSASRK
jgi:regulator of protease activity HflC (stomatin/prohibitin superfamily)